MIGLKIAASGLVVFAFCFWIAAISRKPPANKTVGGWASVIALIALPTIPGGLLLAIWV